MGRYGYLCLSVVCFFVPLYAQDAAALAQQAHGVRSQEQDARMLRRSNEAHARITSELIQMKRNQALKDKEPGFDRAHENGLLANEGWRGLELLPPIPWHRSQRSTHSAIVGGRLTLRAIGSCSA